MGAPTVNRKRGFDHYSPNSTQPSVSHNTPISKKPKISLFSNQTQVSVQKGKSRLLLYPEIVNKIKREVHAPCRNTRFASFGTRNSVNVVDKANFDNGTVLGKRVASGSGNCLRVAEREDFDGVSGSVLGSRCDLAKRVAERGNFDDDIGSVLGSRYDLGKRAVVSNCDNGIGSVLGSRYDLGKRAVVSNCDNGIGSVLGSRHDLGKRVLSGSGNCDRVAERENFDGEIGSVLGARYDLAKREAVGSLRHWTEVEVIDVDDVADKDVEVTDVPEEVQEMEVEANGKYANLEVENYMGIENEDDKTTDLVSLEKKLSLMRKPVHKQLLEDAESRNSKLSSLSFQIELNEKKLAQFLLLRPVKKVEEEVVPPEVLREAYTPLTEEETAEVSRALAKSSSGRVLVTHDNSNISITGELLRCLRPTQWLNDEVINIYLELLKERERREPKKFLKCHFFNTFFYKKLISGPNAYDYKAVRRWTTQRKLGYSLLDCEKIFVPIHQHMHWCLAVIDKKEKKFQYLDSLGGTDPYVLEALARYYVDEAKDKCGKDIDVSSWKQEYVEDLPCQRNGFDCGVFMVKYTDFFSRGLRLCFKQEDMPYFRSRTAKEILRLRAE